MESKEYRKLHAEWYELATAEADLITVEAMRAEDVPEACALWHSLQELAGGSSFDTHAQITCITGDETFADDAYANIELTKSFASEKLERPSVIV